MRFLISGYYGFGNLGDEALLGQIVRRLKTRFPLSTIEVLSAEPESTEHEYGVEAAPRMNLGAVRRAIDRSDVVLSGGGGLLQNATSFRSLLYYANIIRSAVGARKRTMVFAQSIGPLDFWGKQTVRECCKGLSAATVRDERSRELLQSLVGGITVERTADPVFLYDLPETPVDLQRFGLGPGSEPLVIAAVRKTARFDDAASAIAAAVDHLSERYGARVAFVPFAGQADAEAATVVIRKCRTKPVLVELNGLDEIACAIASARAVIGVRLHALILAARFGIPFLAVPYDPKVSALCEDLGYPLEPLWMPGQRAESASIAQSVDALWAQRDELAAALGRRSFELRALADANFTALERVAMR